MSIEASIVIPTHNRQEVLYKCLKALNDQTYPPEKYEIIVINDGSTDGTEEMIQQLEMKPALVYFYQEQTGPAGARNRGIAAARGEFIIFIDDDIIVTPEFIEKHLQKQKENKRVIVHGPVIYTNNPDNPTSEEQKITDFSRAYFATGNVSIRKSYLLEAGLFNESFQEYGWEDLELGFRLQKMKLKAIKAPEARGYHLKHSFLMERLPSILQKEEARGRTAVIFCGLNPSWQVKLATLYWPPFFWLEKILTIGNWPQWQLTYKLVEYLHYKEKELPRNFIVFFMKLKAYFDGMRQGSQKRS